MTGPEQHAATVRSAIWGYGRPPFDRQSALDALDELVALAGRVETLLMDKQAAEWRANEGWSHATAAQEGWEKADGRAEAAEKRADDALARETRCHDLYKREAERAEAAEARADKLQAALRSVAEQPHAPADGAGTDGAVHLYVQGHPMGCPICQAIEAGLA